MKFTRPQFRCLVSAVALFALIGCAEDSNTAASNGSSQVEQQADPTTASTAASPTDEPDYEIGNLTLNAVGSQKPTSSQGSNQSAEEQLRSVMEQLQPLQVMLGRWKGTTRREYNNFKAIDQHEWIWDLQTDKQQPALVMSSDKSPYLRSARLTWDEAGQTFLLTGKDPEGVAREFTGTFAEPVREVAGDGDQMQRVFKLLFQQTKESVEAVGGEQWQLAIAQQENNRYLLEVERRRGSARFRRYDTVSTQREGTSFAINDSDYGDKTCIISQGLGTISVSYKGKSFWVCCTGCKAAFEEDPETWIARAEERKKEAGK